MSLAFNARVKNKRVTTWVDGSLWVRQAESLAACLTQGAVVSVTLNDVHLATFTKADGSTATNPAQAPGLAPAAPTDLARSPSHSRPAPSNTSFMSARSSSEASACLLLAVCAVSASMTRFMISLARSGSDTLDDLDPALPVVGEREEVVIKLARVK